MDPTLDVFDVPQLPPRPADAHKGDYGRLLIVAGSRGMSGAAVLCGRAALRGGAGLVRVAVPESILTMVALGHPCYTTMPLPEDEAGRVSRAGLSELLSRIGESSVLALGPGLGRSEDLNRLVAELLENITIPAVVDADGLNALDVGRLKGHAGPLVLTPHPGEFARLTGSTTQVVQSRRRQLAEAFAQKFDVIVLLKGHQTVVTDGGHTFINTTGNPGMATGGSGDVLTGLIAALLGQGLPPFQAAQVGAYAHGLAGDLARDRLGEESLIATDLIKFLPQAFQRYRTDARREPF